MTVGVSPDGDHIYVGSSFPDAPAVALFQYDAAGGELSFVPDHCDAIQGLDGDKEITVSPDGNQVYVAGEGLATFERDRTSGALAFVETRFSGAGGTGLVLSSSVVVSPDGHHVYVGGGSSDSHFGGVAVFARDQVSGTLTFVDLLIETEDDNWGLRDDRPMAMSPDSRHLYVNSLIYEYAVFERDPTSGRLTFVEVSSGLEYSECVVVSPDGEHVYAATNAVGFPIPTGRHAVLAFVRDQASGALTFIEDYVDGESGVEALRSPMDLAVSPDGHHVYVASSGDNAVAVFERDPASGKLTFVEAHYDGRGGVDGLRDVRSVAVSPDGDQVYAVGSADGALAVFERDAASGKLDFVEVRRDQAGGFDWLRFASSVTVSPDGRNVYVGSLGADAVVVYQDLFPFDQCFPADEAMCLNDHRFRVEVAWRDFAGNTGAGQLVDGGSADSGLFWFFNPDNWEMLVKVLDGCGVNDRYWVFAAATTNVEYTLRVTDAQTGAVKEYFNPLGNAADAITDAAAFPTCP